MQAVQKASALHHSNPESGEGGAGGSIFCSFFLPACHQSCLYYRIWLRRPSRNFDSLGEGPRLVLLAWLHTEAPAGVVALSFDHGSLGFTETYMISGACIPIERQGEGNFLRHRRPCRHSLLRTCGLRGVFSECCNGSGTTNM